MQKLVRKSTKEAEINHKKKKKLLKRKDKQIGIFLPQRLLWLDILGKLFQDMRRRKPRPPKDRVLDIREATLQ